MFINDIWSCGVTTKTKKIVAEAQKDGYLLNFLQLELDEGGLPNWKTINSFCELVRTSASNDLPEGALQSPQEKLDRLMNAIFLKTFNLRNYEEDPLSAGEILLFTKLESIDRRDQFAVNALYRAALTILKLRGLKGGYDVRRIFSLAAYKAMEGGTAKSKEIKILIGDLFEDENLRNAVHRIWYVFKDARGNPERCARGLRELADGIYLQAGEVGTESEGVIRQISFQRRFPAVKRRKSVQPNLLK